MKNIVRWFGRTGTRPGLPDLTKEIISTWSWLLPRTGEYSEQELAEAIRAAYDESNPRTAHDLKVLDGYLQNNP